MRRLNYKKKKKKERNDLQKASLDIFFPQFAATAVSTIPPTNFSSMATEGFLEDSSRAP